MVDNCETDVASFINKSGSFKVSLKRMIGEKIEEESFSWAKDEVRYVNLKYNTPENNSNLHFFIKTGRLQKQEIADDVLSQISPNIAKLENVIRVQKAEIHNLNERIKGLTKALESSMEIKAENENLEAENIKLLSEIKKLKEEVDGFKAILKENKTKK